MPRNSRNPIESRGRMANFRAKPIAIIDVGKDDLGVYPNPLSHRVQFFIGAQQVKKNYDTRVALEWYLDNIFIPDFIKRALKYFVPSGATSSKDKIANYPKPVQDKMLEESLAEHIRHFGLPQVFPVEVPFSFDGHLIVPGDIAIGYTGLVRKSKPVGYYDMPTPAQIDEGITHFGKIAFFRYDWMLSNEELEKRYKLKSDEKLNSEIAGPKTTVGVASANFEPRYKEKSWTKGANGIGLSEVLFNEDYESTAYLIPVHNMTRITSLVGKPEGSSDPAFSETLFYSHYDAGINDTDAKPNSELMKYAKKALDVMVTHSNPDYDSAYKKYSNFTDVIYGQAFGIWFTKKKVNLNNVSRSRSFPPWSSYPSKFDMTLQPGALIIGFTGSDDKGRYQSSIPIEAVKDNNNIPEGIDLPTPFYIIFPSRFDELWLDE